MTAPGRPIRFLVTVALLWVGGRVVMVWPEAAEALRAAALPWTYADRLIAAIEPPREAPRPVVHIVRNDPPQPPARPPMPVAVAAVAEPAAMAPPSPASPAVQPARVPPAAHRASRLSLSAWAIVRPGDGGSLAGGGQLGGSQAGIKARYAITPGIAVAARLSAPLGEGGREAALGVEWRPAGGVPLWLAAERRVREGADAFAVGAYGGIDGVALPVGFLLDGYGQAGIVGLKAARAYVDGAVRVERALVSGGWASLSIGGGLWGAAQPGAARIDVGPQLVARIPLGVTTLRAGLDWRHRIAGDARPGSGPALSIGADF